MPFSGRWHIAVCDECHREYPRAQLVRKLTETGVIAGQNLLPYSSYDTNGWVHAGVTPKGRVSMGPFMRDWDENINDLSPASSPDGFTVNENAGSYTFDGAGFIRTTVAVDISSMDYVQFGVTAGRNHRNLQPDETFRCRIGYLDLPSTFTPRVSKWMTGSKRTMFIDAQDDIPGTVNKSACYFYVAGSWSGADPAYTNSEYWFADDFHLADSNDADELYIPRTAGAAKTVTAGYKYGLPVLCSSCYPAKTYRPSLAVSGPFNTSGWIEIHTEGEQL